LELFTAVGLGIVACASHPPMQRELDLIYESRKRIEAQKQQARLASVLGCITEADGTVAVGQARMAAQLAGVSLPDTPRLATPRVAVKPLLSELLPPVQRSPRGPARRRQPSAAAEYNLSAVVSDGVGIDPEVRRLWGMLSAKLKESSTLVQMMFRRADEDRSGKLSRFELHKVLHELDKGATHQTLGKLIELADVDGDGEIAYQEFIAFLRQGIPSEAAVSQFLAASAPQTDDDRSARAQLRKAHKLIAERIETNFGGGDLFFLTNAFRRIDEDKSGTLTIFELKQFMYMANLVPAMVTNDNVEELVRLADKNGDGEIAYDEFAKMILTPDLDELYRDKAIAAASGGPPKPKPKPQTQTRRAVQSSPRAAQLAKGLAKDKVERDQKINAAYRSAFTAK
tara:strand:+ start:594 stop:1790 length:1197 start_codon:yes stop_codon:yes gene_type:complete